MYYASLSHENDVRNAIRSAGERARKEAEAEVKAKYQPMIEENIILKESIAAKEAEIERLTKVLNNENN
jgi:dynactin complex subunit